MNKRLTILLVIVFAAILTVLLEVFELQIIEDHVLLWSIGSIVLANIIGVWAGRREMQDLK
jgi:uncharacterized membrane protein YfcA